MIVDGACRRPPVQLIEALDRKLSPYLKKKADEAILRQGSLSENRKYIEGLITDMRTSVQEAGQAITLLKKGFLQPFTEEHNIYYDLSDPDDPVVFIEE